MIWNGHNCSPYSALDSKWKRRKDSKLTHIVYWWTLPLLYVGRVCHIRGIAWVFCVSILFLVENNADSDQMPHDVDLIWNFTVKAKCTENQTNRKHNKTCPIFNVKL